MDRDALKSTDNAMTEKFTLEQYERLQPQATIKHEGRDIIFSTPNRVAAWRVQTLMTKEPETIEWIATFTPGDVMVDVGANVGMYTIWAAMTRGTQVYAFEPEAQNYALLNRNIQMNRLTEQVTAFCAAVMDDTRFDKLNLSTGEPGGSCHSFGESVNYQLQPQRFPLFQGCFAVTLDSLVEQQVLPIPNHIKIDVDGFEHKVLEGAKKTLLSSELCSVLVEINTNLKEHRNIIQQMQEFGFEYSQEQVKQHTVAEGPFAGLCNFVFKRRSRVNVPNMQRLYPGGRIAPVETGADL